MQFVDVYPWLAVLEQFDDNNLIKSTVLFNLNDKSTFQSIELLPNSKLYFANIDEISFLNNFYKAPFYFLSPEYFQVLDEFYVSKLHH